MTLTCTIDETGIHKPDFSTVKTGVEDLFKGIYGSDIYIEPDSQDGQFIAVIASLINDNNAAMVATYNAFSPSTAQGAGLSSNVKINGLARKIATFSTVDLRLIGQSGTTIENGIATGADGPQWKLPASVTIPPEGEITVTATANEVGAFPAAANTITNIMTVTRGWQSVTNPAAVVPGQPVETDAQLRLRQSVSTAIPSRTVKEGIVGSVLEISGVTRQRTYENDTNVADSNGIPGHSIAMVIEGGDVTEIGNAIAAKKTPGTGTYGSTTVTVTDAYGIPHAYKFSRPTAASIKYALTVKALTGYTTAVEAAIKQSLVDWTNARGIGEPIYYTRVFVPANLAGNASGSTFEITALTIGKNAGALGTSDLTMTFLEAATATTADVTITVI